jgi:pimeloyl-ACP methyl ester carboxylesterase
MQQVNLVGWSHGGEVSLDFALNNPERIATLTLIEPAAYWIARAYGKFEGEERELRSLFKGFNDPPTDEDLIGFLNINGLIPPGVNPRTMPRWPVWSSLKTALLSLHTVVEHSDDLARLQALRHKPVLLVKGKDSVGANSGIVELLSKALGPNSKVLTLPDAHACHIVAQDQFLAELTQFIASAK